VLPGYDARFEASRHLAASTPAIAPRIMLATRASRADETNMSRSKERRGRTTQREYFFAFMEQVAYARLRGNQDLCKTSALRSLF